MTEPQPGLKIDFSEAPYDPIERIVWLSGAKEAFDAQVETMWREAYFDARITGRIKAALDLRVHSKKRVLAWTRAENEHRGRATHWGDGYSR